MRAEFFALSVGVHPRKLLADGGAGQFVSFFADGLSAVAKAFAPRPVFFRTLDLKSNEYAGLKGGSQFEQKEENPMLGFRGCSRYTADPDSFRLELQAVKRVRDAGYTNVRVVLPFVRFPGELRRCREIIADEGLFASGDFELWMVAEVPSNVFLIDDFLPMVAGVSIGSNDLTQLVLGIDRDSARLAPQFDERDPAVQKAIAQIAASCRAAGKPVSICGNAPSRYPELVPKLISAGLTSLSVSPEAFEATLQAVIAAEAALGLHPVPVVGNLG
jgi:pyruvate,water dikinase